MTKKKQITAAELKHGPSRLLLLRVLKRSANPRAQAALADLEADPELTKEIRVISSHV